MNVMIAVAVKPYCSREEKAFAYALESEIQRLGHKTDMFFLPVADDLLSLPEHMVMMGMVDIGSSSDILISIGYPAFAIPHPNRRICLFSLVPELNEAWNTEYGIVASPQYALLKDALHEAEHRCLSNVPILCSSEMLAKDIKSRHGFSASVIRIPDLYPVSEYVNIPLQPGYILCETDLTPASRWDMLLDAIKETKNSIKLIMFISDSNEVYRKALSERIALLQLTDSVFVEAGNISDTTFNNAAAFVSIPFAARKLPFAVLAALKRGVPVITADDSGCLNEYVQNNRNGLIVKPEASSLAEAFFMFSKRKMRNFLSKDISIIGLIDPIEHIVRHLTEGL